MRIDCESCGAVYAIDDSLISDRGVRAQCPRCGHQKVIRKQAAGAPAPAPAAVADPFGAPPAAAPGLDPFAPKPPAAAGAGALDPFGAPPAAAPAGGGLDPFGAPAAASPFGPPASAANPLAAPDPFAPAPRAAAAADPFGPPAAAPGAGSPFGPPAPASPFGASPFGAPAAAAPGRGAGAPDPFAAPAAPRNPFAATGAQPAVANPFAGGSPFGAPAGGAAAPAPSEPPRNPFAGGSPFGAAGSGSQPWDAPPAGAGFSSPGGAPPFGAASGGGVSTGELATATPGKWRVKKPDGSIEGPLETDEIKERIRAGSVTDKDEVALGDDLFVSIADKRVFGPALKAAGGAAQTDRPQARGASVRKTSRVPMVLGLAVLLALAGGIILVFMKPDLLPGLGGSETTNPFMRQVNLWRLQYPDVDGTAAEHLSKGRKYYLDDTAISHRLADDELRKALLLDPDSADTIAAYVENLARMPGIRQRTEDVKTAFEGVEYAIARDGNKAALHRAYGALLLALDNVQKAQSSLHMALRIDPQDPLTLLLLAESDIGRNNEGAVKQAEQARSLDPSLARVDLIVGLALVGQGQYKAGLDRLQKRLARDPEHIETLMAVAQLYIEIGAYPDAVKTLEKILTADDTSRSARLLLGKVYAQGLGDLARADLQLTVAAEGVTGDDELDETDLGVLVHLAHVRAMRGKWKEAETFAKHALQADTTFVPAHYMMARVLMNRQEPDEAMRYLDRVLQATQGRYLEAPARIALGSLRLAQGKQREGSSEFQRVIENFPTQIRAYLGLAAANASLGDAANMAMAMRKLLDVEPDVELSRATLTDFPPYDADLEVFKTALKEFREQEDDASIRLSSLGIISYHEGDLAAADNLLRQALKEDPKNLAALMYLGSSALRRNNASAALEHLLKAHDVNRLHVVTRYLLGQAQFRSGKLDDAEKTLQDLLNDDSTFLPAVVTLGDIARKRNKLAEAREHYLAAFKASMDMLPAKRGLFLAGY